MPTLSAVYVVKDEEALLPASLKSVRGVADEIVVVVDSRTTDRTREIAREFGATIGSFDWCDDFSAARNHALSLAACEWIFGLDADERLTPESTPVLRQALNGDATGYFCTLVADDLLRYLSPRVFRNRPEIRYEGIVHEMPPIGLGRWETIPVEIQHVGYTPELLVSRGKYERNLRLLEREIGRVPDDPFAYFNRSAVLVSLGRYSEAERSAREAIAKWQVAKLDTGYVGQMFGALAHALAGQGRLSESLDVALEGLRYSTDPELLYEVGATYYSLGQFADALGPFFASRDVAKKALRGEVTIAAYDPALSTHRTDAAIALACLRMGRLDAAFFHVRRAIDAGDGREATQSLLAACQAA